MSREGKEDFVEHVEAGGLLGISSFPTIKENTSHNVLPTCAADGSCDFRSRKLWKKRIRVPRSSNRQHIGPSGDLGLAGQSVIRVLDCS